jgi:hypothetical protein
MKKGTSLPVFLWKETYVLCHRCGHLFLLIMSVVASQFSRGKALALICLRGYPTQRFNFTSPTALSPEGTYQRMQI